MSAAMAVVTVVSSLAGAALVLGLTVVLEGRLDAPLLAEAADRRSEAERGLTPVS